jgi:hypothetical protein
MRAGDDAGAELVELAAVFPILLLLVAGIADFGFLFQRYEVVTNAAREGARVAVLPGYTEADVQARVADYLVAGGLTEAAPPAEMSFQSQTMPSGAVVSTLRVVVEYPSQFMFIGPIAAMFGGSGWGTITLRAVSEMRREGS